MLPIRKREPRPFTAMRESQSLDELYIVFSSRTFQRGLGLATLLAGTAIASYFASAGSTAAWVIRVDFALAGLAIALYHRKIRIDLERKTFVRTEGVYHLRKEAPHSLSIATGIEVRRESPPSLLFAKAERYSVSLVFQGEAPPFELTAYQVADNPISRSMALEEARRFGGLLNLPVNDLTKLGVLTSSAQADILSLTFDFRPGYVSWRKQGVSSSMMIWGIFSLAVLGLNTVLSTLPVILPIVGLMAVVWALMQLRASARWIYVSDQAVTTGVVIEGDNQAKKRIPIELIARVRYVPSSAISSASVWLDTGSNMTKVGENFSDKDAVWLTNWLQARIREERGLLP